MRAQILCAVFGIAAMATTVFGHTYISESGGYQIDFPVRPVVERTAGGDIVTCEYDSALYMAIHEDAPLNAFVSDKEQALSERANDLVNSVNGKITHSTSMSRNGISAMISEVEFLTAHKHMTLLTVLANNRCYTVLIITPEGRDDTLAMDYLKTFQLLP